MNEHVEHPLLVAVASTIADGLPVDWGSLLAGHPEIAEDLKALQMLQEMQSARLALTSEKPAGGA